ncbi:MAG: hypothetical protein AVDCRST_MAG32-2309, partial [uncultured Nocardioides sp.]
EAAASCPAGAPGRAADCRARRRVHRRHGRGDRGPGRRARGHRRGASDPDLLVRVGHETDQRHPDRDPGAEHAVRRHDRHGDGGDHVRRTRPHLSGERRADGRSLPSRRRDRPRPRRGAWGLRAADVHDPPDRGGALRPLERLQHHHRHGRAGRGPVERLLV